MAKTKLRRFYRSNLPTVVWDPKAGRPLAEFVGGQFLTKEEDVAEIILSKGYPEVELDAVHPPDIMFGKGVILEGDVRILPPGVTEQAALNKERAQAQVAKNAVAAVDDDDGDDDASPVPDRVKKKAKAKTKKTSDSTTKKKTSAKKKKTSKKKTDD